MNEQETEKVKEVPVQETEIQVQKIKLNEEAEELVEVDLSDVEIGLLNDLSGSSPSPSPVPQSKDWKDFGVPERVWKSFPRLSHLDFNNKGVYAVLGIVFDHRMGANGEREILFGEPSFQRWIMVNENGFSLKKGMVVLINVIIRNGNLELVETENIMVYQDGALYRWNKKIIQSEKFVV
jgi:hypothetical protein